MRAFVVVSVTLSLLGSGLVLVAAGSASRRVSPLTGERGYTEDGGTSVGRSATAGSPATAVAGALYGTDGQGLFTIDKTTGAATLIGAHGSVEIAIGALAFDADGTLYGTSATAAAQLYTIDPATGAATAVGPLGIGFIFEGGLAFAPSGQLFGVNQGDATMARMFTVDKGTGAATVVGPEPGQARDLDDLTFDGSTLYAIDRTSNTLGTVDPSTGTYTPIGNPGASIGASGGLAIDPADGTLYATFADTGGFYRLDKSTGAATLIAVNDVVFGLAFAGGAPTACPDTLAPFEAECNCLGAANHGAYVACVKRAIKQLPKAARRGLRKCAARSTCGKPGFVTCCRTKANGVTKCSIKRDAARCKAPKNGTARVGTRASCCDACDARCAAGS